MMIFKWFDRIEYHIISNICLINITFKYSRNYEIILDVVNILNIF